MFICKRLVGNAVLPTVSNPGEDLGYDLYAVEETVLKGNQPTRVGTGIAARFIDTDSRAGSLNFGLLLRDRSSMASKGITVSGGVIDAGYTGEIMVLMTNHAPRPYIIHAGDKIAQAIPIPVIANRAEWADELPVSTRADGGFGSTGR